jgi:hypothetical protein
MSRTLYCPTNAHNFKNVELLKHPKIKGAAATCFGLQGNHQASHSIRLHSAQHTRPTGHTMRP